MGQETIEVGREQEGKVNRILTSIGASFATAALQDFDNALRIALAAYGDWDGVPETFERSMTSTFEELWHKPEMIEEIKRLLELSENLKTHQHPVSLGDA